MTFWQRWRFRAESRAIRADLDRLAQRLDHTEIRINQLTNRLDTLANTFKHILTNRERNINV